MGAVRESPAEVARKKKALEYTEEGAVITPGPIMTSEQAAATHQPVSLVEKFALQMGGVEPTKMLRTLKATAFRLPDKNYGGNWEKQEVTNEQMMALLVVANKYGLNPFIKEIYAFPDKGGIVPIVGVDGWSRMINDHDQFDGMKFVNSETDAVTDEHAKRCPEAITCIIYRKDRSHPTEVTEYLDEVYRPAFEKNGQVKSGPWQSHTKRMLRHKSMIQCARIAFGFTGIHDDDEAQHIVGTSEYIPADAPPTQAATLTDRFKETTTAALEKIVGGAIEDEKPDAIEGEVIPKDELRPDDDLSELPTPEAEAKPEPEPEPEKRVVKDAPKPPKDAAKKKAAVKKVAAKPPPIKDATQKFMERIIDAGSEDAITDILTEIAEAKSLSQPKRMVLKRAAQAKIKDFQEPEDE